MSIDAVAAEGIVRDAFEEPRWYLSKTAYNIRIRIETIEEFTRNLLPQNILDIGCGDGSLSLPLLHSNSRLTLLDRSEGMLRIASSRISSQLSAQVAVRNEDFMAADMPRGAYDLIICVGVMAYVEDRKPFIAKIVSALRPGGHLITECTDARHFISYLTRGYETVRITLGGKAFPTVIRGSSDLLKILAESGFELKEAFRYMLPLPGMRRFLSQDFNYHAIRRLFGNTMNNRLAWLGNECLYYLKRT